MMMMLRLTLLRISGRDEKCDGPDRRENVKYDDGQAGGKLAGPGFSEPGSTKERLQTSDGGGGGSQTGGD